MSYIRGPCSFLCQVAIEQTLESPRNILYISVNILIEKISAWGRLSSEYEVYNEI
jgi:hypothetical protein